MNLCSATLRMEEEIETLVFLLGVQKMVISHLFSTVSYIYIYIYI